MTDIRSLKAMTTRAIAELKRVKEDLFIYDPQLSQRLETIDQALKANLTLVDNVLDKIQRSEISQRSGVKQHERPRSAEELLEDYQAALSYCQRHDLKATIQERWALISNLDTALEDQSGLLRHDFLEALTGKRSLDVNKADKSLDHHEVRALTSILSQDSDSAIHRREIQTFMSYARQALGQLDLGLV